MSSGRTAGSSITCTKPLGYKEAWHWQGACVGVRALGETDLLNPRNIILICESDVPLRRLQREPELLPRR